MKKCNSLFRRCCVPLLVTFMLFFSTGLLKAYQSDKITVSGKSMTIREALAQIEKSTDYSFSFNSSDGVYQTKKDINVNGNINQVLGELFVGTAVDYKINGTEVVLKNNTSQSSAPGQTKRKITGTVVSGEDNLPIIGANVWLKNSATGAITNIDGQYTINVDAQGGVLVFSYLGMKTQEIVIGDKTTLDVVLSPDTEVLDEVVVVGYGQQKKESVVGAISTINVEKLNIPGSTSLSNALAGQLSGVVGMNRSGEPGKSGASEFYIRGIASFKGDAKPLVLVDGIERDLDLVDVDDIASFSILKDASASAVYGVRGANGVIIVTTKKGTVGKPVIEVRAEASITAPTRRPRMSNSIEWAEMYNEALGKEYYTQEELDMYRNNADPDLYPNVNWFDELFRDQAYNQNVKLNINGGGDIARYYISGGFYNESSILRNANNGRYDYNSSINYNKFNFRANVDLQLSPSTLLSLNLANIYEKQNFPGGSKSDIWSYAFNTSPNAFPLEYSDGTLASPSTASGFNPWNLLVHSGYQEQFWNSAQSVIGLTQDIGALWEPLKGLKANAKFSWDAWNTATQKRSKTENQYHATGRDDDGNLLFGNPVYTGTGQLGFDRDQASTQTTYLEASLTYDRAFGDHRVGALFLYNHKDHRKLLLTEEDLKNDTKKKQTTLPYKNQGIAGRVTYAFKDRYFGELNMGYNGSENFARGHRFGFFPAVGLGWLASEESWFQPIKNTVDMLKFKGSYGLVGNDAIGASRRWAYESTIVNADKEWKYGSNGSLGGTGIRIGQIENLDVSWEEAKKLNVGLEVSLFKKLRIMADWFKEKREGVFLARASLPGYVGLSTVPYVNIGETENSGYELSLEYMQEVGEVFLTARGNFSYNKNKIIENDEPDWEYKYQNRIGKPFGKDGQYQPFGLIALGLFESQEEIDNSPAQEFGEYRVGDIKYADINGDGVINSYDNVAIGYTNLPEITYGFGLTGEFRGFDINVFFQGVARTSFFTGGISMRPFSSGNLERSAINSDLYNNVWKTTNTPEENAKAIYPRLSFSGESAGAANNKQNSTFNLQDGGFLRMKNVEIGYRLPKSVLNTTFLKDIRFYLSGTNLLTFSKFKLWDPETGSSDGSKYPQNKVVTLGLTAKF